MKITVEFDIADEDADRILQNSIERVFNNGIKIGKTVESLAPFKGKDSEPAFLEGMVEDASILWQDMEDLKQINRQMWDRVRNEIFKYRQANPLKRPVRF